MDELKKFAIDDSLAEFLDTQDVSHCVISKFLATQTAVSTLENILQTLWFCGNIEQKSGHNMTPMHYAVKYGTTATVIVLLEVGAAVNVLDDHGCTPLQ